MALDMGVWLLYGLANEPHISRDEVQWIDHSARERTKRETA
jgi:hypothetical protein